MKLSDFFTSPSNKMKESVNSGDSPKFGNFDSVSKQIRSLVPGKMLQGEVMEKSGTEVKIRIADEFLLAARLEQDVNVEVGRLLTFEVKNNGKTLSLSPLFANTANTDNVMKALQMANLPINTNTVEMTELMMKQGMSIDSHTLQSVYRDINANEMVPLSQIIKLHQLEMPVNKDNLVQLQSYMDMTHHLVDGMEELFATIPDTVDNMYQVMGEEKTLLFCKQLLGEFFSDRFQQTETKSGNKNEFYEIVQKLMDSVENDQLSTFKNSEESFSGLEQIQSDNTGIRTVEIETEHNTIFADTQKEDLNKTFAYSENILKEEVKHSQTDIIKSLVRFMREPEFIKLLQTEFKNKWTILPEQVSDKVRVKEIYERLRGQLDSLKEAMDTYGAGQSTMSKEVTNLRQNIDFMNQLNQMYTYIQLPLKMSHKTTTGELFVYTNKRSLAKENGNVSALLHLNMENLGMIDVYIAMQNHKVNTKFTVSDDDMLDFLNEHMDQLTKRLQMKGYILDYEMKVKESNDSKESPIELLDIITNKDRILSQYSFDVRA